MSIRNELEQLELRVPVFEVEDLCHAQAWIDRQWRKHHPHRPPRHPSHPWLVVNNIAIQLLPNQEIHMDITLTVGQNLSDSIVFLDASGAPMLTQLTLDALPTWTQATPATETLTASADGLTFSGPVIAPGSDTVTVTVSVNGTAFKASQAVTADAAPQVFTSIDIKPTVT